jgi:peptidoglycan/xylan/chitin deacetylase (PgdA/CDA1 family)
MADVNVSIDLRPKRESALRQAFKSAYFGVYKHAGLLRVHEWLRHRSCPPYVTVFLFHRVTDQIKPDGLTVTTSWFRAFCRLMRSKYHVVPVGEAMRQVHVGKIEARRTVAITFDDSYEDNFAAARTLHEHGLPATFFIPTQYVGTDARFPWDAHLPPLPNLTWDQIRQMAAWGHDIGSHSVSHPNFSRLSDDEALFEMAESRRVLTEQVGVPPRWFAFPYGGVPNFRPEQASLVAKAGYEGCFSALHGFIESSDDGPVFPRQPVPYFRNLTHLEMHINRCLDWFYRMKRGR